MSVYLFVENFKFNDCYYVKIGSSKENPHMDPKLPFKERIRSLQTGNPYELTAIGYWRGADRETEIQKSVTEFKTNYSKAKEWFLVPKSKLIELYNKLDHKYLMLNQLNFWHISYSLDSAKIQNYINEIDELKWSVRDQEKNYNRLSDIHDDLYSKFNSLTVKYNKLDEKYESEQSKFIHYNRICSENRTLQESNNNLNKNNKNLQNQLEIQKKENRILNQECDELYASFNDKCREFEDLELSNKKTNKNLKKVQENLVTIIFDFEELQKQILDENYPKLKEDYANILLFHITTRDENIKLKKKIEKYKDFSEILAKGDIIENCNNELAVKNIIVEKYNNLVLILEISCIFILYSISFTLLIALISYLN